MLQLCNLLSRRHTSLPLKAPTPSQHLLPNFTSLFALIRDTQWSSWLRHCATSLGTRWRSWLRHCATSLMFAGSIGIFHRHNPSSRTTALRLTQSLPEMSTRNISWGWGGKGGQCVGLTT